MRLRGRWVQRHVWVEILVSGSERIEIDGTSVIVVKWILRSDGDEVDSNQE